MRRGAEHIRNFYDDDDRDAARVQPEKRRWRPPSPLPFSALSSTPLPESEAQPHSFVSGSLACTVYEQPAGRGEPSPSSSSSARSSVSIEQVIRCEGTTFSPRFTPERAQSPFDGDERLSLRELRESVDEAVRDVRRLDALTRKAVWHALTQHPCARDREHRRGATTACVSKVSPGTQRGGSASPGVHQGFTGHLESTTLVHMKPFLPPDRHPLTPALQDTPDHLLRNLSGALFAAHRAGLFEKHQAWMQRRFPPNTKEDAPGAALVSSSSASTRRKALQRISTLTTSVSAASRIGRSAGPSGEGRAGGPMPGLVDSGERRVDSSVSLIILRVAKIRAIATVFLRQLRLEVYTGRVLREGVDLRYSYYIQRRLLRRWCNVAAMQRRWRISLLSSVVFHWQRVVCKRETLRGVLSRWRGLLQQRSRAFAACRKAQRQRFFQHWMRVFTRRRERSALYEAATEFTASWQQRRKGPRLLGGHVDEGVLFALLEGRPHSLGSGTALVTAVGPRLLLRRLFLVWRQRTELRLMAHLAEWHCTQQMRATVVRRVCSCAHRVALKHHRGRPKRQQQCSVSAAPSANGDSGGGEERSRAPHRVHVGVHQKGLLKYKITAAQCIAGAAQLRKCFNQWRIRFQARRADRFHLQCVYVHAVCQWLQALGAHRAQRHRKQLVFSRWVAATEHRRTAASASQFYMYELLRHAHQLWRRRLTVRLAHRARLLRGCFQRWRDEALRKHAKRALQCTRQRYLLRQWHQRAQMRMQVRTNLYVADTISETALMLGCFRQWCFRAAERRRTHLAWDVLVELRRERLGRWCFNRWRRRTFGPELPLSKRPTKDRPPFTISLLV
ncbi:hypothetical protein JKF63_01374 [Porcisia hertigi]|uniref:Sfi1 spindle body domain-containing protein n=1 Tax=Porcisia hertigi TaxID=2761500 RepID=A0A836HHJ3_9TRYP|nr:hypothetical protein JKF63_01374 [Porcisia hertigi]